VTKSPFVRIPGEGGAEPVDSGAMRLLVEFGLLPTYVRNGERCALVDDLRALAPLIDILKSRAREVAREHPLLDAGAVGGFPLSAASRLDFTSVPPKMDPAFCAAMRRILGAEWKGELEAAQAIPYLGDAVLTTRSAASAEMAATQIARVRDLADSKANVFANSAYYMGSKRALSGLIVEAAERHSSRDTVFVDLMCGSGVVAGAAGRSWECVASDAQVFCRLLAIVQGGGFSRARAERLLARIMPCARQHAQDLASRVHGLLSLEDRLFHSDIDDALLQKYRDLSRVLPTFPGTGEHDGWKPAEVVRLRRSGAERYPYALFTAYFAGVYFGLRQCVEIDSLRFAIDTVAEEEERDWALGVLVAALSGAGTTYGAHFAQPPMRGDKDLPLRKVARLLENQAKSLFHEFAIRLENLAAESERAVRPIRTVPGPWREALNKLREQCFDRDVLVYVDAPYRREEYSRYYHVLETAVRYDYPSAIGRGKVPLKSAGGRFASPFFTRNVHGVEGELANIIQQVLAAGWKCIWSYSDAADANIATVIDEVATRTSCQIESFAAPYRYRGQGGHNPRAVTEFVVVFSSRT